MKNAQFEIQTESGPTRGLFIIQLAFVATIGYSMIGHVETPIIPFYPNLLKPHIQSSFISDEHGVSSMDPVYMDVSKEPDAPWMGSSFNLVAFGEVYAPQDYSFSTDINLFNTVAAGTAPKLALTGEPNVMADRSPSVYTMYQPTLTLEESDMPLNLDDRQTVQDIVRSEVVEVKTTLATHTEKFNSINTQLMEMNKKLDGIDANRKWTITISITLIGILVTLLVGLLELHLL